MKRLYDDTEDIVKTIAVDISCSELQELISDKEENEPRDKRSKIWKVWKNDINLLMQEYNSKFGKTYSLKK